MKFLRLSLPFAYVASTLLWFHCQWWSCLWVGVAGLIGWLLTPHLGRIGLAALLGAGFVGGALCSLLLVPEAGWLAPLGGAFMGFLGAMPLAPVVGAAEWLKAERGSLLEGAAVRCTWIVAALVSLAFLSWARIMDVPTLARDPALALSGVIVSGCTALDARRLLLLGPGPTRRIFCRQLAFDLAALLITLAGITTSLTT